ncbi:MAG TPA: hypothetical protein VMH00_01555 [Candidatus Limnocylindrales bacterium]|nr:hypothetical protein [Candidatus Limnocylindrales bacterium]
MLDSSQAAAGLLSLARQPKAKGASQKLEAPFHLILMELSEDCPARLYS